jgi:DNA-binding NarL/FixJ family response regulator
MGTLRKILLVDDDDDLREALSEQLVMTEDFDVFEARTGAEGMEKAKAGLYDLVILDGFDAEAIPGHLRTLEFLESVKRALIPGGIAVANVWGRSFNTFYADMLRTYSAAFEELYVLDVEGPGTKIFIGCPQAQSVSREQLLLRAAEISGRYGFRHALEDALTGFRTGGQERSAQGAVLRDP